MRAQSAITLSAAAEGGCLCGAVRYRVTPGALSESGYCHCRTCQRQSGAPVVAWFAVPQDRLTYLAGAPARYRASDRASREYCSNCGTYLLFREDDSAATLGINTATLDDPSLAPPEFHIYVESRIDWFDTADSLPRHSRGKG